ncbi:hypothetical protein [Micromonospora sp. HNM0581]|uniref:hypothetical protein n=1 Tax=Micromonospora sp. HNM0581 TaxID=2716341 RepID=UPI001F0E1036|nr:hypothetical protein [Micromonospora sp. HNM0581]
MGSWLTNSAWCWSGSAGPPAGVVLLDSWVPRPGEVSDPEHDPLAVLRSAGHLPDGLPPTDLRALSRMVAATTEAFREYRPSRGARFPVHLLRAAQGYPAAVDGGYDEERGWFGMAIPRLTVSDLPADHFSLLLPPQLPETALQMSRVVRGIVGPIEP